MINLYIFNETRPASVFGVGTYIRELIATLQNSPINLCLVHLKSDNPDIQIEEKEGVRYWHIPPPIMENRTMYQKQMNLYFRNVVYLLQLLIEDKNDLIFQLNFMECKPLADSLKSVFDCKIVLVVHYLNSAMTIMGNISRFRRIISQSDEPTDEVEKFAKESFLKEKELFQSVDKIVCLANHTFDMLHQDYQIEKDKLVVIPNGLSDGMRG